MNESPDQPVLTGRRGRWQDGLVRWASAAGVVVALVVQAPQVLRSDVSAYDGGVYLTFARFTDFTRLPYRDLWTVYGPGPPILSSVTMDLFGRGWGAQQVVLLLVHITIVAAAFLLAKRFVSSWVAAALAALVATTTYPFHYAQTIALILWGLWLTLRASDDPSRMRRRLVIAAFLFGMCFWGRYEFVPVAVALVVALWFVARGQMEKPRLLLLAGLAPATLFLGYLVGGVGVDRAWLNLVEFPLFRYPELTCRGVPAAWAAAGDAFAAPLHGSLWTKDELILWTATFLAPAVGVLCMVVAWHRRRLLPLQAFVSVATGVLLLILWTEHRPRYSGSPVSLLPLLAVSGAILLGSVAKRWPILVRFTSIVLAGTIVVTLSTSWVQPAVRAWSDWPAYDPLLGWNDGGFQGLYDKEVWSEVAREVQERTAPGEEIFVALMDNRLHWANAPIFYWLADRPPATRFFDFNPCLTDTPEVQREIVGDLAAVDVVVETSFFPDERVRRRGPGSRILDVYLSSRFAPVYRGALPLEQEVIVLERRGSAESPGAG